MAELAVEAVVLWQNSVPIYLFSMNSSDLNRLCYVTPRSHDAPEEIQRILDKGHASEITSYIEEPNTLLPTAIVVSLEPEVTIRDTASPSRKIVVFPEDEGKFAYVLDGQHRLAAFKDTPIQFDLPVTALFSADEQTRVKVFADINSEQVPIDPVQILELYYQIHDLSSDEEALVTIVHQLNEMEDSPLKGKVKVLSKQRNTWVKNTILVRFLRPAVSSATSGLAIKPPAQQAKILKEYFKAVQELWPNAWDTAGYVLSGSAGLEVMLGVFPAAKHRVDLNAGKDYSRATFLHQLEPLRDPVVKVEGPDGKSIDFKVDWRKERMAALTSSQKGRARLIQEMSGLLAAADG